MVKMDNMRCPVTGRKKFSNAANRKNVTAFELDEWAMEGAEDD